MNIYSINSYSQINLIYSLSSFKQLILNFKWDFEFWATKSKKRKNVWNFLFLLWTARLLIFLFTFSLFGFCSIEMLYHLFNSTLEIKLYFLFWKKNFSSPLLFKSMEGFLSKAKTLDQPLSPLPFTNEWMIRSNVIQKNGPQVPPIAPIFLFLFTFPWEKKIWIWMLEYWNQYSTCKS